MQFKFDQLVIPNTYTAGYVYLNAEARQCSKLRIVLAMRGTRFSFLSQQSAISENKQIRLKEP